MKLNIVKDKAGKVVATFEKVHGEGASVTPVLDGSHSVHEIEVEEKYLHNIDTIYKQHSK